MSALQNRRGGNVPFYIQTPDEPAIDSLNPDDLEIWTNTEFFDFDGSPTRERPPVSGQQGSVNPIHTSLKPSMEFEKFIDEFKPFDGVDYSSVFVDYSKPESHLVPEIRSHHSPALSPSATAAQVSSPQSPIGVIGDYPLSHSFSPVPATPTSASSITAQRNVKRKASANLEDSRQSNNLADASRFAAEEDKRRRNTAASARFRVKKKQKEQQMEKTAKEMMDRNTQLEQRIQQLEMENKWLKNLIVEKNGGKSILAASEDAVDTIKTQSKRK